MPLVKVEILKGKSNEYKKVILDCVHQALVDAIKIPNYDRIQRLYELDKEHFEIPASKTEDFILIEITMFAGRSLQAKRNLYKNITESLEHSLGIKSSDITIVLHAPPLENWGIRGCPASEIDIGFEIKV